MPAHILGFPVEESVLQLAPAGAAMVTTVAVAGRAHLSRLRRPRTAATGGKPAAAGERRNRRLERRSWPHAQEVE
jgi:hypothetical protein